MQVAVILGNDGMDEGQEVAVWGQKKKKKQKQKSTESQR